MSELGVTKPFFKRLIFEGASLDLTIQKKKKEFLLFVAYSMGVTTYGRGELFSTDFAIMIIAISSSFLSILPHFSFLEYSSGD